jgi:hypothetical protein
MKNSFDRINSTVTCFWDSAVFLWEFQAVNRKFLKVRISLRTALQTRYSSE